MKDSDLLFWGYGGHGLDARIAFAWTFSLMDCSASSTDYNVGITEAQGMQTAEVVIIGGGIVGSSIAWHLTEANCRNVLMVERESHQGKGSTGKSMGGVRAQFATAPNIQMSLYSIPFYENFEERLGHPSEYRAQGYLFVATKPAHLEYLQTNQRLQKSLGLTGVRMLVREEIVELVPQLRSDDILGGASARLTDLSIPTA